MTLQCVVDFFSAHPVLLFVLESVASGFISAFALYLFFRLFLTPKVSIASRIAKTEASDGRTIYKVKVVNERHRALREVRAYLHRVRKREGSEVKITKAIPLTRDLLPTGLEAHPWPWQKNDDHVYRFTTFQPLAELLAEDGVTEFLFRLAAVDAVSGIERTYRMSFVKGRAVVSGDYVAGSSLEIVPDTDTAEDSIDN